jgi:hypothetical protein
MKIAGKSPSVRISFPFGEGWRDIAVHFANVGFSDDAHASFINLAAVLHAVCVRQLFWWIGGASQEFIHSMTQSSQLFQELRCQT